MPDLEMSPLSLGRLISEPTEASKSLVDAIPSPHLFEIDAILSVSKARGSAHPRSIVIKHRSSHVEKQVGLLPNLTGSGD
jgi:hypothetical protein